MGWRSPGRAEQSIIDTAKVLTATACRLCQGSEALDRRVGVAERCRIVCAERGIGQADPDRLVHSSRFAIKPAVAVKDLRTTRPRRDVHRCRPID